MMTDTFKNKFNPFTGLLQKALDGDNIISNANALVYKGSFNASTNPNYPVADAGWLYVISAAGRVGGASGEAVEAGDMMICNTDDTASGDQATVGSKWDIFQKNMDGAVTGPASSTDESLAIFDGTSGKIIKDASITLDKVKKSGLGYELHGGGAALTTGYKGGLRVPFDCTILGCYLFVTGVSGSIAVDIWNCSYADYDGGSTHPVDADSITGSAVPAISAGTKDADTTLTGWTKSLSEGDWLGFNIDSNDTVEQVLVFLDVKKR